MHSLGSCCSLSRFIWMVNCLHSVNQSFDQLQTTSHVDSLFWAMWITIGRCINTQCIIFFSTADPQFTKWVRRTYIAYIYPTIREINKNTRRITSTGYHRYHHTSSAQNPGIPRQFRPEKARMSPHLWHYHRQSPAGPGQKKHHTCRCICIYQLREEEREEGEERIDTQRASARGFLDKSARGARAAARLGRRAGRTRAGSWCSRWLRLWHCPGQSPLSLALPAAGGGGRGGEGSGSSRSGKPFAPEPVARIRGRASIARTRGAGRALRREGTRPAQARPLWSRGDRADALSAWCCEGARERRPPHRAVWNKVLCRGCIRQKAATWRLRGPPEFSGGLAFFGLSRRSRWIGSVFDVRSFERVGDGFAFFFLSI